MPDPTAIIAGRYGNLKERQFEFQQERAGSADVLKAQQEARANAIAERDLALKATTLQHETQQALDTAGFLQHFQHIQHTDPQYEDKIAGLAATYPMAAGDKSVQSVLGVRNTARSTYIEAAKQGGAYDFPEGPARDAFHKTFKETGDFNAARANAKSTAADDKAVRDAVSQGYLTAEDLTPVAGQALPPVFNKDGSINYTHAKDLAAQRAGATTGATNKAEDRELATAQAFVQGYMKNPLAADEDPNAKELYTLYTSKLLDHARKQAAAGAAPAGSVPATQAASPGVSAPDAAMPAGAAPAATPTSIASQADYEALAPGATFLSNGKMFRKPTPK